jgi:hypothetical protein
MMILKRRFTLAAGVATLALLALPSLAVAIPGKSPETVQRTGRFVVVHADRFDGKSTQRWLLVNGSQRLRLKPPEVWIDPGARVRLTGTMEDGALEIADSPDAVTELAPAPLAASTTANAPAMHRTAVILAGFMNGPGTTGPGLPTAGTANSTMFGDPLSTPGSLNSYYLEQTYGQIGFSGDVFGPLTLPGSSGDCGTMSPNYEPNLDPLYIWLQDAEQQIPGFSEASYDHIVLAIPSITTCMMSGVAGVAEVGFKHVWINGAFQVRVLAHELGHNLGLKHAGGLVCTAGGSPTPISNSCNASANPYGDPFDAMGRATTVRQMSMQHKLALNLLPPSAVKIVGASGAYRIAPMETLTGTAQLLRIPKPGGGNYFVEYRYPFGFFDGQAPLLQGVLIRTESPASSDPNASDTSLIDMHPTASPDWTDATMGVGQSFSDALTGIALQTVAQDETGATLNVTVPLDVIPPGATGGLSAVVSGTSVALQWAPATDNIVVDAYRVTRDGSQVGTPTGTAFTDSGLVPGTTVAYTVTAVDPAGNGGPAAALNVAIPDTTAPAPPARLTAKLAKNGNVTLSWPAATDDGRVTGYRVLRAGKAIASGNELAYVDKAPKPGTSPTLTYSVVALDLAGNVSPATNAKALRSALLRKLAATGLKLTQVTVGARTLLRVKGKVSDFQARCRLRVGKGSWHACKAKPSGAFSVNLIPKGTTPVTLSLRDSLGRTKLQTLRVR